MEIATFEPIENKSWGKMEYPSPYRKYKIGPSSYLYLYYLGVLKLKT